MPNPANYATNVWPHDPSADYLHLIGQGGAVPGWIDKNGVPQGTLAVSSSGVSNPSSSFNALDPTTWYWREDWQTSSTSPANTTPFGLLQWEASNWIAGSQDCSIQQTSQDGNHFRYLTVSTDGSSAHGAKALMPMQQFLTTGNPWSSRIIFKVTPSVSSCRALAGFGATTATSPLAWLVGVRCYTLLGSPDTNFMFVAGTSDGSSGSAVSSGVPLDTNWHDLVISWVSNNQVSFVMDGGSAVLVSNTPIDDGIGLYPGLWCESQVSSLLCNFFAFQYTGMVR